MPRLQSSKKGQGVEQMNVQPLTDGVSVMISVSLYLMVHAGTVLNLYSGLYSIKLVNAYLNELNRTVELVNKLLEELAHLFRR
jgi:hypothetical protein